MNFKPILLLGFASALFAMGSCTPPSTSASCDCQTGFDCVNGKCLKPCQNGRDCSPAGKASCGSDNYCVPQCQNNDECDNNQDCLSSFCFQKCETDSNCANDEHCENNYCQLIANPACHNAFDCPNGNGKSYQCLAGECILICSDVFDCLPVQDCQNGFCQDVAIPDCATDSDCNGDQKCFGARCHQPCVSSANCPGYQECKHDYCFDVVNPSCRTNNDCADLGSNYSCYAGKCLAPCETFLDCQNPADICQEGHCLPATNPACTTSDTCPSTQSCHGGRCLSSCTDRNNCTGDTEDCLKGFCLEAECQNSFACLPTQKCREGFCLTVNPASCNSKTQCAANQDCFEGQCIKSCVNSTNCEADEKCFLNDDKDRGVCLKVEDAQCSAAQACSGNQTCYEGQCHNNCENSLECRADERCYGDKGQKFCLQVENPNCSESQECTDINDICYEGDCHKRCNTFSECQSDEKCQNGMCLKVENPSCHNHSECENGKCLVGSCHALCTTNKDLCQENEKCAKLQPEDTDLLCLPLDCFYDSDCRNNQKCFAGRCRNKCFKESDCESTSNLPEEYCFAPSCQDGLCMYDTPKEVNATCPKLSCTENGKCDDKQVCQRELLANNCLIDGQCYYNGELNPQNACQRCNVNNPYEWSSVGDTTNFCLEQDGKSQLINCDKDSGTFTNCALGCKGMPNPHCVEPSNWGYWDGDIAHRDGITQEWINGATKDLTCASGYKNIIIDTDARTIKCGEATISLNEGDAILVDQDKFYDKGNKSLYLPPDITLPQIAAFRFNNISLENAATVVTCVGSHPLSLAAKNNITIAGNWFIRCGNTTSSQLGGASARPNKNRYDISGGAGGGYAGGGGNAGKKALSTGAEGTLKGGAIFGNNSLQPMLGGSSGGNGLGANEFIYQEAFSSLEDMLSVPDKCLFNGPGMSQANCFANTASLYNIDSWLKNVWYNNADRTAREEKSPLGGLGGGALQLVALEKLETLPNTKIHANGQGGQSLNDCAKSSADYLGNEVMDANNYPVISHYCNQTACKSSYPKFGQTTAAYPWFIWILQTGGGGGSGGALLIEAPQVTLRTGTTLDVAGGGGGSACYMQGKSWQGKYTSSDTCKINGLTINHSACAAQPIKNAGVDSSQNDITAQYYGYQGASPSAYGNGQKLLNFQGSDGDISGKDGNSAPSGYIMDGATDSDCINSTSNQETDLANVYDTPNDEVNFDIVEVYQKFVNGGDNISWGGAGGASGRIRINSNKLTKDYTIYVPNEQTNSVSFGSLDN